jgi:hypothetical protein
MKTKHGLFISFAVLLVAAMFTFTGCADPTGGTDGTIDFSGTLKVGQQLTASITGDFGGNPFSWYTADDSNGVNASYIETMGYGNLTIGPELVGKYIQVRCTQPDKGEKSSPWKGPVLAADDDDGDRDGDAGGADYSVIYGVYVPSGSTSAGFGNVSLTETTITIRGSTYTITLEDVPFTIYGKTLYIVYINYRSKKVGAVVAKSNPELFLGMSLDAMAAWSFMGSAPAYIVEDDLGVFAGDKQ